MISSAVSSTSSLTSSLFAKHALTSRSKYKYPALPYSHSFDASCSVTTSAKSHSSFTSSGSREEIASSASIAMMSSLTPHLLRSGPGYAIMSFCARDRYSADHSPSPRPSTCSSGYSGCSTKKRYAMLTGP